MEKLISLLRERASKVPELSRTPDKVEESDYVLRLDDATYYDHGAAYFTNFNDDIYIGDTYQGKLVRSLTCDGFAVGEQYHWTSQDITMTIVCFVDDGNDNAKFGKKIMVHYNEDPNRLIYFTRTNDMANHCKKLG